MPGEIVRLGLGDDDDACVLNRRTSQLRKRSFLQFRLDVRTKWKAAFSEWMARRICEYLAGTSHSPFKQGDFDRTGNSRSFIRKGSTEDLTT